MTNQTGITIAAKARNPFAPLKENPQSSQPAPSAWGNIDMSSPNAIVPLSGTAALAYPNATNKDASSTPKVQLSVEIGKNPEVVPVPITITNTNAQDVVTIPMEPSSALLLRKLRAHSPLIHEAWERLLREYNLLDKYPLIPNSILVGFNAGIPTITRTYAPPNHVSVRLLPHVFNEIVNHEFARKRYLGPFSQAEVEALIGPFQTSPLSLVNKPGKPNQYRMVQNLSHPHNPSSSISSINHHLNSDLFPCTWGTFSNMCLLIWRLPPGTQAACRDVAEAYRTIPLDPSQWPGTVVRLSEDNQFAINTSNSFGLATAGGVYGIIGDASTDLMRAAGIGPVTKWVDDHVFFRIPRQHLNEYNHYRREWQTRVLANGGKYHEGGRIWYRGNILPDGQIEEFDEDFSFPLSDLSSSSLRSPEDAQFTYNIQDIDKLSNELGIPWKTSKDVPFTSTITYLGFVWDLNNKTVTLSQKKKDKYLDAIHNWQSAQTHTLEDVQKLYGKLLHTCLVVPRGRAYLTNLEAMLGIFQNSPFKPRHSPSGTANDLNWWFKRLSSPQLIRAIPGPLPVLDVQAFSDASSSIGIGIIIGKRWRAWRLIPGWQSHQRDIGWAEAIGFELLIRTLCRLGTSHKRIKIYCDNTGVVEGWWSGRSRNSATNIVFRRIHDIAEETSCQFFTRYVPSKENLADGPSRGIYPPCHDLLPQVDIPIEIQTFVTDFDAPLCPAEILLRRQGNPPRPHSKTHRDISLRTRATTDFERNKRAEDSTKKSAGW